VLGCQPGVLNPLVGTELVVVERLPCGDHISTQLIKVPAQGRFLRRFTLHTKMFAAVDAIPKARV
jgi:hypothetical protein